MENRYHPMLPTIEEASISYDSVTSDHVPILTTVPFPENITGALKEIKLISWNVLADDGFNGFAPLGRQKYGETPKQSAARHDLIAASLKLFVDQNKPQIIALQEITARHSLTRKIQDELGDDWEIISAINEHSDECEGILLFNKNYFTNASDTVTFNKTFGGPQAKLKCRDSHELITIQSVHADYSDVSRLHEQKIKKFLDTHKKEKPIIIGDFNCTIAPLHTIVHTITTNVATSFVRDNKNQGACAIDGCFYIHNDDYKQAHIVHLNPETGKAYDLLNELKPLKTEKLSDLQQAEVQRYNMMICVDKRHGQRVFPKTDKHSDMLAYETYLQEQLNSKWIFVRVATNLNNEKGIAITLPIAIYNEIKEKNNKDLQFKTTADGKKRADIVFIPQNYIHRFIKELDTIIIASKTGIIEEKAEAESKPTLIIKEIPKRLPPKPAPKSVKTKATPIWRKVLIGAMIGLAFGLGIVVTLGLTILTGGGAAAILLIAAAGLATTLFGGSLGGLAGAIQQQPTSAAPPLKIANSSTKKIGSTIGHAKSTGLGSRSEDESPKIASTGSTDAAYLIHSADDHPPVRKRTTLIKR